jgi:Aerotolerance regulator N-terminal/von Willebrand factor type A domain
MMAGLGLLAPLFLLGSLAVAIPIALHLLRQRAGPVQAFSAVQLLQHSRVEQARRRRLRDILLFALRAAALIVLAVAFARPYLRGASPLDPPVTVVVADVSGSLSDPARSARLRDLAAAAIDRAPASQAVALVQFSSAADVLVAPTHDHGAARAAAARLVPGYGSTSYRAGLAKAAELVSRPGGHIVVVTDLQAVGWTDGPDVPLRSDVTVDVADVGALPPDVAVLALERDAAGRTSARVRAGSATRQVPVRFEIDGDVKATATAAIDPSGIGLASVALAVPPGAAVRALVGDPNGLRADDERWLVDGDRSHATVLIVTSPSADRDGLYVQRALQALDGARAVNVVMRTGDRVQNDGVPAGTAAVILLGTSGLDRRGLERLAQYVRSGGGLLLAAGPGVTPELIAAGFGDEMPRIRARAAWAGAASLVASDTRHPALALFADRPGAFADARFTRSAELRGTDGSEVLARFDSGEPALVAGAYGKGRVAVLASDVANRWNDLALQPSFVPLMGELVAWIGGATRAPQSIVAGQSPLEGADRPGVVTLPAMAGHPEARVAVNVDLREFDAARLTAAEFVARVPRVDGGGDRESGGAARHDESSRGLWRYGLLLVAATLVAESLIGRRA